MDLGRGKGSGNKGRVVASLEGDNLILKKYYHIGFAADTPQGLAVPVIRDADKKGVIEIAKETGELAIALLADMRRMVV